MVHGLVPMFGLRVKSQGHSFGVLTKAMLQIIGLSGLRATSGLAEQLRETTIFGIFPLVVLGAVTLLAFTPEGIVVGF